MKLSEAFETHLQNEVLAMNYSVNTIEGYRNLERKAIGYFGNINVKRISLDDIHGFYLEMIKSMKIDSARDYIVKLRVVLKTCRARGIKTIDPDDIKTPRAEKKTARFLTHDEYLKFLASAEESNRGYSASNRFRNVLMIKMLYYTGLRISELCALNRNDIVNRQFSVVGKSKHPRPCYITKEIEDLIHDYLAQRKDGNEALFISNQNGERLSPGNAQRIFRYLCEKSGLKGVTPHTLRHSFATSLVENGVDIRNVATLLGHQSLSTTQQYTHIRDAHLYQVYQNYVETMKN